MLTLKNITKDYVLGDTTVHALRGVDVSFRKSEFVSILGPSGCGKTTLLNIIGGLDQYTSGDLLINEVSTKRYKSRDWDSYRNHSVGFVFQTYNLIPHQNVLSNVELALTLSGVSKKERRRRAKEALEKVGLGDQLRKRPSQMSGGQMQRVAIARALVNDPDILLADEPTGALDTETSVQIMELLKEVAQDRLVIMVTHNPDLAEQYSTRIVHLLDGRITGDSNPYTPDEKEKAEALTKGERDSKLKKPNMGAGTAMTLSLNNLMTKKARTILTAFAGSIGIIGIALVLSLSNGIQLYIDRVQEDTLSTYPLEITSETADLTSLMSTMAEAQSGEIPHEMDAVYSNVMMSDMVDSMLTMETRSNDLGAFSDFIESEESGMRSYASSIQYIYNTTLNIYSSDTTDGVQQVNPSTVFESLTGAFYNTDTMGAMASLRGYTNTGLDTWGEMLDDMELLMGQYDVIAGQWPQAYNEVVLIVDEHNEINDVYLYSLGIKDPEDMDALLEGVIKGETLEAEIERWEYSELIGMTYKLVLPTDYYRYNEDTGAYEDMRDNEAYMKYIVDNGLTLTVVGILRPNEDAVATALTGAVAYRSDLTSYVINAIDNSQIVIDQRADETVDVFTNLPFDDGTAESMTDADKAEAFRSHAETLSPLEKANIYISTASQPTEADMAAQVQAMMAQMDRATMEQYLAGAIKEQMGMDDATIAGYLAAMSDSDLTAYLEQMLTEYVKAEYASGVQAQLSAMSSDELAAMFDAALPYMDNATLAALYDEHMPPQWSDSDFDRNMSILGVVDLRKPSAIRIYSATFADKDGVVAIIDGYNEEMSASGQDEKVIKYTDFVGLLMSSITNIINVISYVLIAFVSISLVVSSIMIGIITYISVLERTKEIGILRAMGASKRDISRVFNCETLIVGFVAGFLGIAVTLLIDWPASIIVENLTGVPNIAVLPQVAGLILVGISMVLTFIAGLIPSRLAAKKDPVEALRTE